MRAPYGSTYEALRRAYSKPRGYYGSSMGQRKARDHDALERSEMIAQDSMVRAAADHHCSTYAVYAFEILWCDDHDHVKTAMEKYHQAFCQPGRNPPVEFVGEVLYRWRRGLLRRRGFKSDREWGEVIGVDRGTVAAWRRKVLDMVRVSYGQGYATMSNLLRERGLIEE